MTNEEHIEAAKEAAQELASMAVELLGKTYTAEDAYPLLDARGEQLRHAHNLIAAALTYLEQASK